MMISPRRELAIGLLRPGHLEAALQAGAPADVTFGLDEAVALLQRFKPENRPAGTAPSLAETDRRGRGSSPAIPLDPLVEIQDPVGRSA